MSRNSYLPALRFPALTRAFDAVVGHLMPEQRFKQRLVDQATLRPEQRVLDLGCGTGTLAIMAMRAEPDADVVGLDADPEILELARAKAREADVKVGFDRGLGTELPYEDASFDRVLSTLFFHHLTGAEKRRAAGEVARVLRPGGELHVADWGVQRDLLMRVLFTGVRVLDGFERTRDNATGALPAIFEEAGLDGVADKGTIRTAFGAMTLFAAKRPVRPVPS